MRAVVQRVREASVIVAERTVGTIGKGLLVLLGVGREDKEDDAAYISDKVVGLRIFPDRDGKMNLSVSDVAGEVMVISQFTLFGDVRRGKRPSFTDAAAPEDALRLYDCVVRQIRERGLGVVTGEFGAMMQVRLINDGPVTILLDSKRAF